MLRKIGQIYLNPDGAEGALPDDQFQAKVLGGVKTVQDQTATLVKNLEQLDTRTKSAFEDLEKVKQTCNNHHDSLLAIKKVQSRLEAERMVHFGDPMRKFLAVPENRETLNLVIRSACMQNVDLTTKAGAIVSGGTPGSTMVINQLAREIYDVLGTYGVYNTFAVRPLSTKTTTFPVSTARAVAGFITSEGGQIGEDATKDATTVDVTPVPIGVLLYASKQMVEDAEQDVASMVMDDFAQAFAYRLDWACLAADGTADATDGGFTGIFSGGTAANAAAGNKTIADLEYDDVLRCLSTVAASVLRRQAKWWIHPTVLAKLMGIKDANKRSIFLSAIEAPAFGAIGSILGYPVVLADAAPSTDAAGSVVAAFGDPNGLVVGLRTAFEFMASDEYKFDYLRRYYRGVGRAGAKIRAATAFAKLTTAAA